MTLSSILRWVRPAKHFEPPPLSQAPSEPEWQALLEPDPVEDVADGSEAVLRLMAVDEQARQFLAWMRDMGFLGWHPHDDVDAFYAWWAAEAHVAAVQASLIRTALHQNCGVVSERRRVANGELAKVGLYMRRTGRPQAGKVSVYFIHDSAPAAAAGKAKRARAEGQPAVRADAHADTRLAA